MVVNLTGHPEYGIPADSTAKIEAFGPGNRTPRKNKVWEGEATDSINVNLDEGKYVYMVSRETQPNSNDYLQYIGAFYVGLAKGHEFCELREGVGKDAAGNETAIAPQDNVCPVCEPIWKRLSMVRPQFSTGRQTTNGVRYKCGFVGCRVDNVKTALAMVKHEAQHQGIDLIKTPERVMDVLTGGKEIAKAQIASRQAAPLGVTTA